MKQVEVNIRKFPKFVDMWLGSGKSIEQNLRDMNIIIIKGRPLHYIISEEDYTWFVLRWS